MNTKATLYRVLKILYVVCACTLFLPWFTYDSKMMGYCWGWQFLVWFLPSMAVIGLYLFMFRQHELMQHLSLLGGFVNLILLVIIFGRWQSACNIKGGINWMDGFVTATPMFWLTALAFGLLFGGFLLLSISGGKTTDEP